MKGEYRLIGTVQIPEEKKKEFNGYVQDLLWKCGIRKTEEIILGNRKFQVVTSPKPDENGIIEFNYSIYEKKKRRMSSFSTHTCLLTCEDRDEAEFGVAMNLVMALQEMYSETPCFLVYGNEACPIDNYAALLNTLLGIVPIFDNRSKVWDMFLMIRKLSGFENIDHQKWVDNMKTYLFCNWDFYYPHIIAMLYWDREQILNTKTEFDGNKENIKNTPLVEVVDYICGQMRGILENGEESTLSDFLKKLLGASLDTRRRWATEDGWKGIIAELSLYALPPAIIWAYATANNLNMDTVLNTLDVRLYSDIMSSTPVYSDWKKERANYKSSFRFYKAIMRENEDEFVEFWGEEDRCFSKRLEEQMNVWKENIQHIKVDPCFDMEKSLVEVMDSLENERECRLVDKQFIHECMANRQDENYKKAVLLYKQMINEPAVYFPELTRSQVTDWIIKRYGSKTERDALAAFHSLMINHNHRNEVLGF